MARAKQINLNGTAIDIGAAPSATTPSMNGTAAVGTETAFARGDHVHPTDTSRQATITGGASSITSSNLTASRALVSNSSGKVAVSAITSTELGYLDNLQGNVQAQLNEKLANVFTGQGQRVMVTDGNGNVVPYVDGPSTSQLYALRNIDETQTVQNQIDSKAPINHQSTTTDYGVGTAAAYGHVKVANNLSTASFEATDPVVLSAYQGKLLYDGKAPTNHKSTTSDYGLGSGTEYGHVKVINNVTTSSYSAGDALAAYQGKVLQDGIDAVTPTLPSVATTGKSNQSITSATDTNMGSFTLAKGLWLVTVTARWNANASGVRQVWLASSSTGSALNYSSVVSHQGANGAITSEQLTVFLNVTSQTTYYIVVRQSSGSALTCNTQYSTCRLGDA